MFQDLRSLNYTNTPRSYVNCENLQKYTPLAVLRFIYQLVKYVYIITPYVSWIFFMSNVLNVKFM